MIKKTSFELGTAGGLVLGVVSIFGSFLLEGGELGALILIPAMTIVFGGTFAATMIGVSFKRFLNIGKLIKISLLSPQFDFEGTIDTIVLYSKTARKEGILALEKELAHIGYPFLQKMLRFVIDGTDPETLRSIGEAEIHYSTERHLANATIFQKMGGYSPTMGIIGTVMGLIVTLANAGGDPNDLIHHIATAFIATMWGVFMANLVWLPIADKLKTVHAEEKRQMEMVLEGILAIHAGEIPSAIRARLNCMLATHEQEMEKK